MATKADFTPEEWGLIYWAPKAAAGTIMEADLTFMSAAKETIAVMKAGNAAREKYPNNKVIQDLIPEIDRAYRTLTERTQRAIAGLSMGAGQALSIGLTNLDKFAYLGAFSGGSRGFDPQSSFGGVFKDVPAANNKIRLLWMGCGSEDRGFANLKATHEQMDREGIQNTWFEGPGSHEWQVWRKHLHAFAPLLFAK